MSEQLPVAYLNGQHMPLADVRISPLDRGFLFGEGVYEVVPVYYGQPFNLPPHIERLRRSLALITLACPLSDDELASVVGDLIAANGGGDMSVYLHFTRGVSTTPRNHVVPAQSDATVFGMCQTLPPRDPGVARDGVAAITLPDLRWARCDIKATSLLANTMARQLASESGAVEAILLRDDDVTEGAASSVFVVLDGQVIQPPPAPAILPGTTAGFVTELLAKDQVPHHCANVTESMLRRADEIWLASSTRDVLPVTTLDNKPVGAGRPGPIWQRIDTLYQDAKDRLDPARLENAN